MKYIIDKKIRVGYLTAFLLLLLSYILLFFTTSQMFKQTAVINHKDKVINKLEELVSNVKEAESNYRGFIILKDSSYREAYLVGLVRIDSSISKARELIIDSDTQVQHMDSLEGLVKERFAILDRIATQLDNSGGNITDTVRSAAAGAREKMEAIKRKAREMQYYEGALMEKRMEDLTAYHTSINTINIASLIIAVLLSIYSLITYTTENKSRREADEKALQYRLQLESRIGELDEANKQLTELKLIEKFAATGRISRTIAHEVRNPLTNISLATEQLRDMVQENDEGTLLLNMIKRNGDRINQLVSDLLNATKYSELQFARTPLNDLLNETLENAKDRIELNGITLKKEFSTGVGEINVDKDKMKIAFLNIIVNAIEAMKPGEGILTIKTDCRNNKCYISIKDNGIGMNRESLSKLFEPFFTNKEKGTGLGLTNTQNIILNHKGNISVESEPGVGTTFTIVLDS